MGLSLFICCGIHRHKVFIRNNFRKYCLGLCWLWISEYHRERGSEFFWVAPKGQAKISGKKKPSVRFQFPERKKNVLLSTAIPSSELQSPVKEIWLITSPHSTDQETEVGRGLVTLEGGTAQWLNVETLESHRSWWVSPAIMSWGTLG